MFVSCLSSSDQEIELRGSSPAPGSKGENILPPESRQGIFSNYADQASRKEEDHEVQSSNQLNEVDRMRMLLMSPISMSRGSRRIDSKLTNEQKPRET
jgi:hypothetical protein